MRTKPLPVDVTQRYRDAEEITAADIFDCAQTDLQNRPSNAENMLQNGLSKRHLVAAALIDGMPFQGLLGAPRAVWVRVLDQRLRCGRQGR